MLDRGLIPREAVAGHDYEAAECRDCLTLFQVQVGGERVLTELYEVWAASEPSDEWRRQCEWFVANARQSRDGHQIMAVASMLGRPIRSLRTLDYGMGYGLWARIAGELGCASFSFDFADDRTHAAKKDGIATLTLDQIRAERFDLINMEQGAGARHGRRGHAVDPCRQPATRRRSVRLGARATPRPRGLG